MHVHRYEKLWLVAALVLIVGFIATVTYGAVGLGIEMVDDSESVTPDEISDHEKFSEPGVEHRGGNEYDVYVVAYQFNFNPGTERIHGPIEVPAGSRVTFHVTSQDVIHGFEIVGTNVNTMVIPGEVTEITVEFDEPGEYGIICNEYCGAAHHNMEGKLTVVPEDEYDGPGGENE